MKESMVNMIMELSFLSRRHASIISLFVSYKLALTKSTVKTEQQRRFPSASKETEPQAAIAVDP